VDERNEQQGEESKRELTDADLLRPFTPKAIKEEFNSLHVTPAWRSRIQFLTIFNCIGLMLLLYILYKSFTVTGPAAIGLFFGIFGPFLILLLIAAINVYTAVSFIRTYHPKGGLLTLIRGVIIISGGLLFWVFILPK
jgi:hypothetical protein